MKKIFLLLLTSLILLPWAMKAQTVFHEGFESGIPATWTTIDSDSDGYGWLSASVLMAGYTINPHEGNDFVSSQSYDENTNVALTPDNWLITPAITLGSLYRLTFWVGAELPSYAAEHWGVYISTTSATNLSSFTLLYQETIQNAAWTEHIIDLSAYAGQTVYIAFRHFNCTDQYYLNLDDVTVGPTPTCFPVSNVMASSITVNSADIIWVDTNANPYSYQVEVNGVIEEAVASPHTLANLTSFTTYTVRVRPICAIGDTAAWSAPITFSTQMDTNTNVHLVADGTTTNNYVPVYGYWADSPLRSQTIYPASMLGDMIGGTISALTYYLNLLPTEVWQATFSVKLATVPEGSFSSASFNTANTTTVYTGVLNISNSEMTIMFSTPFTYTGGNLLVEVQSAAGSNFSSASFLGIISQNASIYSYNSNAPNLQSFIPKTKFYYTGGATCLSPSNTSITNITSTSADFSWTPREAGLNYEVYIAPTGTVIDWTTVSWTYVGTDTSYTFTGLNHYTDYTAYVRAICNTEYSSESSISFKTLADCSNITIPYVEDFNNYTNFSTSTSAPLFFPNVDYPICWTFLNNAALSSNYPQAFITSYYSCVVSGKSLLLKSSNNTPLYAILPEMPSSFDNLQMTFTYRTEGLGALAGTLHVGYMTSLTDASTYVNLCTYPQTTTLTEVEIRFDTVTVNPNNTYYIVFKYEGGMASNYYASIDDVTVTEIPVCTKPANLAVTSTTSSSVTLSWTEEGTSSSWNVVYGPVGFDPDTVSTNIENVSTTPTVTIGNLVGGVPYEFYVQADCGNDVSEWRGPLTATPGAYNMGTSGWDTLHTCGSVIYDDGGPDGNYSNNVSAYLIIYPEQPGSFVQISGTLVAESSNYDYLGVYDGAGTSHQLLMTNQSSNTLYTIPTITSSTGPLTIYFHSDVSASYAGYEIFTTCVNCVSPYLNVDFVGLNEATVNWNNFIGTQTTFELAYGLAGFNPDTVTHTIVSGTTSFTMSSLTPGTTYEVYIRSQCEDGAYANWTSTSFTTLAGIPATLPYTCGFEDVTENASWNLVNGLQTNKWYIGGFVHNTGDSALYISDNNGANNNYNISSASSVWAYRDITFDNSSEFSFSFDWRCDGESGWDYMELYLGALTDVTAGTSAAPAGSTLIGRYHQQSTWQHESITLNSQYANTTQRLYILWKNDNSGGNSPAGAIDNIEVIGLNCGSPYNLIATSLTSNSVTVNFVPASSNDMQWQLVVLEPNDTIDASLAISFQDTTYSLTNLVSGIQYRVYVRTDCGGGEYSEWVGPLTFMPGAYNMGISGWDTLYTCGDIIYDNGGPNGNYSSNTNAYLVLYPDQPGSFMQISGTLMAGSSFYDYLIIYDGVGTANQILKTNQSPYTLYTIPTITSSTGPLTIYFHSDASGEYAGYEIFTSCINCLSPTLTVSNLTDIEATLDWSSFTGSQTNFEIVYGAAGFNPDTETPIVVTNATTYTITGLSTSTLYDAYIRTNCGDGTYSNWTMVSFNTACSAIGTFPYTENFATVAEGALPTCWTSTGSGANWVVTGSFHGDVTTAHSGSKVLQFYQGGRGDQASLQLPTFDLTSLTTPTLSFWYTNEEWSGDQDEMIVYYRTSPTGTWTQLRTYNTDVSVWTFDSLDLPSPSATYQIKFEGISDYGYGINLDEISIYDNTGGSVVAPTVITEAATGITQTTATLHGTVIAGSEPIIAQGFEAGIHITVNATGDTMSYNLTGLTPNTGYTFRAFATTASGTTYGAEKTFTTLDQQQETCPAPTNLNQAIALKTPTVVIIWVQEEGAANEWKFFYKKVSESAWNSVITTEEMVELTVEDSTLYEGYVVTHCTNGLWSEPSDTIIFQADHSGIDDYTLENTVTVYPNPTRGNVQVQSSDMMESLEIYDMYGKLLNTMKVSGNETKVDLTGYAAGTYFVRVTTDKGVVTKRVVKQ